MPATESTWYDTLRLHRVFAVTGVLLTIGTVWMFWKDHARNWKTYQVTNLDIDLKMMDMRQQQFQTGDALLEHERRAIALSQAKAQAVSTDLVAHFQQQAAKLNETLGRFKSYGYPYSTVSFDSKYVDREAAELNKLSAAAAEKRAAATEAERTIEPALVAFQAKSTDAELKKQLEDAEKKARQADREASQAEAEAGRVRARLVEYCLRVANDAHIREDKSLGIRKFKSGEIDAAKANYDIAVRDSVPEAVMKDRETRVNNLVGNTDDPLKDAEQGKQTLAALNEVYQRISAVRKQLERDAKQMAAPVDAAQKAYDDSVAELERLRKQEEDRQEKYVQLSDRWPFVLGKRILTLPILDAFNSPRKIDNLWSDGLTQDYNFSRVRRFDRCTTCHQAMVKTQPGSSTSPAFIHEQAYEMVLVPPSAEAAPKPQVAANGKQTPPGLAEWLGLKFAHEGLLETDDVTVSLVLPKSPAAKALLTSKVPTDKQANGLAIREAVAEVVSAPGSGENLYPSLPGLMVGDRIDAINGHALRTSGADHGPRATAARLVALAEEGKPIHLTVVRGLPNPFISHPRLDLYLSDSSPHRMQVFACTICHDGQGSATAFEYASHTPSTTLQMRDWTNQYGWFDNPHWIYPMYARRFAESGCLKCHHNVVELEPSDKFADAPAPKVTHGYHLIRKYGCYGCHEVNGFDGPNRRIGPDLRSEPNYFAVAQQIDAELAPPVSGGQQSEAQKTWREQVAGLTHQVAAHPEDNDSRLKLKSVIEERVAAAGKDATLLDKSLVNLANMLKDVETPGTLRRPGPSLRYIAKKVDPAFVYDWIENPRHFRPTTRMPRFFGQWNHLKDAAGHMVDGKAPRLEPIEIRGILAYIDSYAGNQVFEPEPRPSGISDWTSEEKAARGKVQFQTRGCLACHNHKDFPEAEKYRSPTEIVQGPDLSGVGSKFAKDRNAQGPTWLYSWIKNPTRYHARTVMPNLFLDPQRDPGADLNDPKDDKWFDPADDIVSYLLTSLQTDWQPIPAAMQAMDSLDAAGQQALKELTLEYLNEAFYKDAAEDYYVSGIPPALEGELKGAEKDLIVPEGQSLKDAQRLKYIGRKTISKYGCFGCHDIPGFEDAKPIGTGLADWGRKDPAKLAFEHITHYAVEHGHASQALAKAASHGAGEVFQSGSTTEGQSPGVGPSTSMPSGATGEGKTPGQGAESKTSADALYAESAAKSTAANPQDAGHAAEHAENADFKSFYTHALEGGNRIGFIYQKLKEPRSYDYEKTENKRYNERLRMPQFPFSAEEREAVITFVLGLVADPPQPKYIFQAQPRNAALIAGRQVLEKYNCGGCHILGLEKWQVSYAPGEFGERPEPAVYPYLKPHFSPQEIAASTKADKRNELHATLEGLPPTEKNDGYPLVFDQDNSLLDSSSDYADRELKLAIELYNPTIVDGSPYLTGQLPVIVPKGQIDARYPTTGGMLTKYLLPVVTRLERQVNPNASGSEAYGWLPPPLTNEGQKVQTPWLHDFLLEPYEIRPATFLRMPKFNMSSAEATALADYFAAVDNAEYPYAYSSSRDRARLESLEKAYEKASQEATQAKTASKGQAASASASPGMDRLDDAMKIVVNGNFCVKCHLVADYAPPGSERAKAPQLADVYRRLRPEYVRNWIANPKMILPYTSMPVNIPYQEPPPVLQQLYHGTNVEQVQALTDLLMNFDQYARHNTRIAERLQPAPAEGTPPPAAGGGANE